MNWWNIICIVVTTMGAFGLVLALVESWAEYRHRARKAEPALDRYRRAVDDLDRWCGHSSPHARLIAAHLVAEGEGLNLNAGTPVADEPCTISGLREQLWRLDHQRDGQSLDEALIRLRGERNVIAGWAAEALGALEACEAFEHFEDGGQAIGSLITKGRALVEAVKTEATV